ncbi:MAG: hypothetical protein JWP30_2124 [Homoserinimonas sp.]|jgi:AcrR family transcriptional regulator|nr:hypothetical protein [Homoserinimonas sp.]
MTSDEGLRARKQRETRETIHKVAIRHALAEGPDSVTVAAISTEAGVSSRTFFNYFPSKEDAMLGFHEKLPTDAELDEFASEGSDDLLRDIIALMRNVFSPSPTNSSIMKDRRDLIAKHPQLMQRQMSRVFLVEQRIATVAADRMRQSNDFTHVDDVDASARMLVMLATGVVRFAIREATLTPQNSSSFDDTDAALESSLKILREVVQQLT